MSNRRQSVLDALTRLLPGAPAWDRSEILGHALASPGLAKARPEAAAWLSAVAHIRHLHTDYDTLLDQGYGPEAARHFTLTAINAVLADWGSPRRLDPAAEDDG